MFRACLTKNFKLLEQRTVCTWRKSLKLNQNVLFLSHRSYLTTSHHSDYMTTIRKLLRTIGSEKNIHEYMRIYGTPGLRRTAVIKIGGEVLENDLDVLIESLKFLKNAGLHPVLIHGAGPQMNAELKKAGVNPEYVGGMRVTTPSTLSIAKRIFLETNRKLVDALELAGVPSRPITSGVFEAELKDIKKFGLVGEISKIHGNSVRSAIDATQIPVLSSLGESNTGQILNINADVAARELSIHLQPYKTIFINAKGGWIEADGTKLNTIDMSKDYQKMAARDYTGRQGTLLKLNEIKLLLDSLPNSSSVALTSASELSKEILSSSSSGTICIRGNTTTCKSHSHGWISSASSRSKYKAGLLGARGYVGREMIRLIGSHPEIELVCASSRALRGQKILDMARSSPTNPHTNLPVAKPNDFECLDIDPQLEFCDLNPENISTFPNAKDVDVWILALPNGHCAQYVSAISSIGDKKPVLVDLSADQRFNNQWTYGLPETPGARNRIRNSKYVSNPGCYATGAQLALLPLLTFSHDISIDRTYRPHVFGVSGYSGAGTGPSNKNNPLYLKDNIVAYSSLNHIHEREISHQLELPVSFLPHVAPYFQGIHLTVSAKLKMSVDSSCVKELYEAFYKKEPLIQVSDDIPLVRDNAGSHQVVIGGFQIDPKTGRVVIIATIDNLLKGAATQAMQNINIALGLEELEGIPIS